MRAHPRSTELITLAIIATTLPGLPALAADTGTRVSIRTAEGTLPDVQKLVEALESLGAEHQARASVQKSQGQDALTLELWGNWVPGPQIAQTLRDGFPVLSSAEIEVTSLDADSRPKFGAEDGVEVTPDSKGNKTVIKKIVRKP